MAVVSLSDYFESHYVRAKLLGKSSRTVVQYRITIRLFSKFLGREATLADLNDSDIPDWFASLLAAKISNFTINKHRRQLLAIARLAVKKRHLSEVPEIPRMDEIDTDPVCWTMEQMGELLDACANTEGKIGPEPRRGDDPRLWASDFWVALVETLLATGARIGVVMQIPPDCYDREERLLLLPARFQKQKKDQWMPLSQAAIDAIEKIYNPGAPYLFNWPFDRKVDPSFATLHDHFREIILRAGLDCEHGTFHRIRRTRATYGEMASPGSATRDLGHSDSRVTERYISKKLLRPSRTIDLIPRPQLAKQLPPVA